MTGIDGLWPHNPLLAGQNISLMDSRVARALFSLSAVYGATRLEGSEEPNLSKLIISSQAGFWRRFWFSSV